MHYVISGNQQRQTFSRLELDVVRRQFSHFMLDMLVSIQNFNSILSQYSLLYRMIFGIKIKDYST